MAADTKHKGGTDALTKVEAQALVGKAGSNHFHICSEVWHGPVNDANKLVQAAIM